jgi:hypothetical protein
MYVLYGILSRNELVISISKILGGNSAILELDDLPVQGQQLVQFPTLHLLQSDLPTVVGS